MSIITERKYDVEYNIHRVSANMRVARGMIVDLLVTVDGGNQCVMVKIDDEEFTILAAASDELPSGYNWCTLKDGVYARRDGENRDNISASEYLRTLEFPPGALADLVRAATRDTDLAKYFR